MKFTHKGQFGVAEPGAPLQPFANGWLNLVEMSGMDARRLPRLDRREDFERPLPPRHIDARTAQAKSVQFVGDFVKARDDLRLAIMEKRVMDDRKPLEFPNYRRFARRKRLCQQRAIFEIA